MNPELHTAAELASMRAQELRDAAARTLAHADAVLREVTERRAGPGQLRVLRDEVAGLRRALESRATIEQAKGIVIAATGCDADEAFAMLVRQSQHENRRLREVAEELVASKIRRAHGA